jgi:transglutaminase-like putative cysteine protease
MEIAINKQVLIFLLASIGLITLPHFNHLPLPLFATFSVSLIWRFICIWNTKYLPNKAMLFALTVAATYLLYTQHLGVLGRDAGTSLFVIALGLKLLEIKQERDLYLVNYLAFIVAASQFLYQQSILMAIYILLVCCVLLATLVSINSQKPETWASLKTAVIIVIQALPISIILFVLFPRIDAPRWMIFEQENSARTGLSDSLEPGAISQLGLSDELVFRVKFKGNLPPPNKRYWRGPVYSYTDGQRWTEIKSTIDKKLVNRPDYQGTEYQYTLMMEPQDKNWIFALDMPSSFPHALKKNSQYQLINPDNKNQREEYKFTSFTQYNTGDISKIERDDNLQLPAEPSNAIKQLVRQLNGFDQSAEIFIQSILTHFKTENFHYTLRPPLMGDQPIETFLFKNRYGFCSHYATAFVYLMRVAGIPARVVGGYQGGEFNQVGNFLEIRQANAHAWAEVWLENKGWTRFDPTAAIAPERIEQDVNIDLQIATGLVNFSPIFANAGKAMSWMKQARQMWSNVDYSWQRWVINYSSENQTKFLSSLGINDIKSILYWLFGSIGFVTAVLAWAILRKKHVSISEELMLYQLFCKKMAKVGFDKKAGETAQTFSLRIQNQRPDLAGKVINIAMIYTRLRYEKSSVGDDLILLKREVASLRIRNV